MNQKLQLIEAGIASVRSRFTHEVGTEEDAVRLLKELSELREQRTELLATLPYHTFTVHVVLDRGVVDGDADGADWVSALLTDNGDVADWEYASETGSNGRRFAYVRPVDYPAEDEDINVEVVAASAPYINPRTGT